MAMEQTAFRTRPVLGSHSTAASRSQRTEMRLFRGHGKSPFMQKDSTIYCGISSKNEQNIVVNLRV